MIKNNELSNTIMVNNRDQVDPGLHSVEFGSEILRVIQFGDVFESDDSAGYFCEILSIVGPKTSGQILGSINLDNFIMYENKKLVKMGYSLISTSIKNKQIIKDEVRLKYLK